MHSILPDRELRAWIRLSQEPGLGPAQARGLLAAVGLPHDIFALSASSLAKFAPHDLARQLSLPAHENTELAIAATLEWLGAPEHPIVTLADPGYPPALLDIYDTPPLLYVNGNPDLLIRPTSSIVGARNASAGGIDNATAFARYLSEQGWCIASGLALGIDAAAHRGAMRAGADGGGTLAVLGTGIDIVYPAKNRDLAHQIAEQGALVSEFPLGARALAYRFPKRNRIVAGLARGVLVVEAARQSGSLITAKLATDAGREVFAIPGSIHSPLSRGCHALIRQGAKLVESGQDIHDELGHARPRPQKPAAPPQPSRQANGKDVDAKIKAARLNPGQTAVLEALGYDPVDTDVLRARTRLDLPLLNQCLLELELNDIIMRLDNGQFQRRYHPHPYERQARRNGNRDRKSVV